MAEIDLGRAVRPLRHRDYRRLGVSLVLGLFGTGVWVLALVWQVVALDGGPGALSLVTALGAVGMLATILLGGALADRVPRRRVLVGAESVRAVTVGLVAALSLLGALEVWHLAAVSLVGGLAGGLYLPAYSAALPSMLPADELLAANGLEGVARPVLTQSAGPAVAGLVVAVASPGAALAVSALAGAGAAIAAAGLPPLHPEPRDHADTPHPVAGVLRDVTAGVGYMVRTPWLLATLLFAAVMVMLIVGPIEVLTPFVLRGDGHGPGAHALVLTAFGLGGAAGSLVVSSLPMPRRYLSTMILLWALACVPLASFGLGAGLGVMVASAAVLGALFNGAIVLWGTLLQRRVPAAMLGRVSSLDFFVSIALVPLSMALAGPVSEAVGLGTVFVVAAVVPLALAAVTILVPRLDRDELAHPLTPAPAPASSEDDRRVAVA